MPSFPFQLHGRGGRGFLCAAARNGALLFTTGRCPATFLSFLAVDRMRHKIFHYLHFVHRKVISLSKLVPIIRITETEAAIRFLYDSSSHQERYPLKEKTPGSACRGFFFFLFDKFNKEERRAAFCQYISLLCAKLAFPFSTQITPYTPSASGPGLNRVSPSISSHNGTCVCPNSATSARAACAACTSA